MITKEAYNLMKEKYGMVGSWAVWRPAGAAPRSNTNDMSWVNDKGLLNTLNTGFVFVGLNWSSTHGDQSDGGKIAWANFHSGYCRQNDYKLRYAVTGTRYWGSYITDLIKLYSEVDSSKVDKYLRKHPEVVGQNIKDFEEEISYLGGKLVLVALGGRVFSTLNAYLGNRYKIVQIKHYSYTIGKEDYRKELIEILDRV